VTLTGDRRRRDRHQVRNPASLATYLAPYVPWSLWSSSAVFRSRCSALSGRLNVIDSSYRSLYFHPPHALTRTCTRLSIYRGRGICRQGQPLSVYLSFPVFVVGLSCVRVLVLSDRLNLVAYKLSVQVLGLHHAAFTSIRHILSFR
jgi:hypothetical protein